jgi:DNA-binding SARP family transcriptional activator
METPLSAGSPHLLRIAALGRLDIQYEGHSLTTSLPLKGQALLVYLALASGPYPRDALAGLLWPGMTDEGARTNLRLTLSRMRRRLPSIFNTTRHAIAFDHNQPYTVDALDLQALAARPHMADQQRLLALLHSMSRRIPARLYYSRRFCI